MLFKKKWLAIFFAIIAVSFLNACSDKEKESEGVSRQDAEATSQDAGSASHEFMSLSDALEKYSLWIKVEGDPYELTRNSSVDDIFVFENDKVQQYRAGGLTLEDLVDMSDDEIIKEVINRLQEGTEDYEEPEALEYTLDITLDDLGKDSQFINVETTPETVFSVINETAFQTIFDTPFSGLVYNNDDRSDYDEHIITRVEDESILFKLDDSNTDKSIVTIEEAEELEMLRKEREEEEREAIANTPEELYKQSCLSCHGGDLEGVAGPQLANVGSKLSEEEIYDIIVNGQGGMPGGTAKDDEAAQKLAEWLSEMK